MATPDPAWQYDAAGHITRDPDMRLTWDAAGRNREVTNTALTRTSAQSHDGTGQVVKHEQRHATFPPTLTPTYYVRSSVLGGQVITEVNASGQKQSGYVYLGTEVLAVHQHNTVTWRHDNPLTGSRASSNQSGRVGAVVEVDPMGVDLGRTDPFIVPPSGDPEPQPEWVPRLGRGEEGGGGGGPFAPRCFLDRIETGCSQVSRLIGSGAAVGCPNNDCGPRTVYNPQARRWELSGLMWNSNTGQLGYEAWRRLNTTVRVEGEDGVSDIEPPEWERVFVAGAAIR